MRRELFMKKNLCGFVGVVRSGRLHSFYFLQYPLDTSLRSVDL